MNSKLLTYKTLGAYNWGAILLLHGLIAVLRLLYAFQSGVDLDPEEAQYWLWSQYPDWSYYSKPPLIAYINGFTTSILGSFTWVVRLNAILLGSVVGLVFYHIVRQLYNNRKLAFVISAGLLVLPAYHYISLFFTTDVLAVLGWLLTTYFFWQACSNNRTKYWALAGLSLGLGLLGKYTLLYFIPFSFLYLLFKKRNLLTQNGYYLFLFTGIFLFLPVIIWNLKNGMLGALHVAYLAGAGKDFPGFLNVLAHQSEFIGGQLLLNLPFLCLLFFWKKFRIGDYLKGDFEQYVISSVAFVLISFFALAFFKQIRINWLLFSYFPLYLILIKAIWESRLFHKVKIYMVVSFLLLIGLIFQPIFAAHGTKMIPVRIDPFSKLMGWQKLGEYIDKDIRAQTGGEDFIILSDKYQIAAQLSFYTPGQPPTYCLPYSQRRMNQYDVWGIPSGLYEQEKNVVFIKSFPLEEDKEQQSMITSENLIYETQYSVMYKGEKIKTYFIYLLKRMPEICQDKDFFVRY